MSISERLTPAEAAPSLRLSTVKVRELCAANLIAHERDGRRYWLTAEGIEAYRRKLLVRAS